MENLDVEPTSPPVRWPSEHNARIARQSPYPPHADEKIDWGCRLFDSDGYEHSLVVLGGVQVVTKLAFAFVVWDRRDGVCVSHRPAAGEQEMSIGNEPMSDLEKTRRQLAAMQVLRQMYPGDDPRLVAIEHQLGVAPAAEEAPPVRDRQRGG